ncbi:MAG: lipopolysaccharide heptosyltransferase II [Candidatus Omnitrophica bacterium]|nr:lipopolysaccharide heptosyltransferase II [Candidatus Omnitrophota bacterium]
MGLTVLQLLPSLKMGGVETGTVDLARNLIAQGHRAIVISSGGPLVKELEAAGAIHYTLPIHQKVPWTAWKTAQRVAEVVESHGVDVIHARSRVPAIIGFLAWRRVARKVSFRLGGRKKIPCFITTSHGYYSTHLFSRIMGWGRVVIANSDRVARHMIDDFHVPPERIRRIPRGVDLAQYHWREPRAEAPKGEWNVAVVGRITPIKGHRDLLRAFAIAAKSFPRARLKIVGEAEAKHQSYLHELKKLTYQLGLEERVEFVGHEPEVSKLLEGVDLLVLSSTAPEAFGRVLIEAGAAGVPVVATRVGGIPEVILDRKTGLLVPPADPVALGEAIMLLLKDRALARVFSRENRRRIETVFPLARMVSETLEVYREASERLRIAVIKFSAVGDVVLITPSLRALRERFPQSHITVVVGRESRELLHRCPYVDDLVVFDLARQGSWLGLAGLGWRLARAQVDLVVDFQNNRRSHWLGWLSGAPQRYGFAGRRWSGLLSHRAIPPERPVPPVEHQFRILQLLGVQNAPQQLELWPGPPDEARVDALLKEGWIAENQPLIAVHPGARWNSKRWPTERFAQLADKLASEMKARVILTGSGGERALCEEIHRLSEVKPLVTAGRTSLNELAALLRRCKAFVGGDSAPLHIAAAGGTPTVALFGSTDPVRHAPPVLSDRRPGGPPAARLKLLRVQIPCSPCYRQVCPRRGAGHMECMRRISVEEVCAAVRELL